MSATSDDFDTFLQIIDANGEIIASDDDGGEGVNAEIADFTAPANGLVTVRVTSFSATLTDNPLAEGVFTLTVSGPGSGGDASMGTMDGTPVIVG
ncbi:MAG: hypothetical protein AAF125_07110, partial [Chloroflexota bacterium]